jgi:hypothetical protein
MVIPKKRLTGSLKDGGNKMQDTYKSFIKEITPNDGETFDYKLTNVVELELTNGVVWYGFIRLKNRIVGEVEYNGNGGSYSYQFRKPADRADFLDAVKEAYSGRKMVDVEADCFINYLDFLSTKAGK